MVLTNFTGDLGSGKTLGAVYLALRHFFMKGRRIYSNINLYGVPFFKIDSLDDLNRIKDGFALLDEFWQYAESRLSRNVMTRVSSMILLRSRKRELTVTFTAQSFNQLDVRVRNITDFLVLPVLSGDDFNMKMMWFKGGKKPVFYRSMYCQTLRPMMAFNSWEEAPDFAIKDALPELEFCYFDMDENPAKKKFFELWQKKGIKPESLYEKLVRQSREDLLSVLCQFDYGFTEEQKTMIINKLKDKVGKDAVKKIIGRVAADKIAGEFKGAQEGG